MKSGKGERRKEEVQDDHKVARNSKNLAQSVWKGDRRIEGTLNWLKKGSLKKETESVIIAAKDQAISMNNNRKNIYKEDIYP